jgi:hypothetical protein
LLFVIILLDTAIFFLIPSSVLKEAHNNEIMSAPLKSPHTLPALSAAQTSFTPLLSYCQVPSPPGFEQRIAIHTFVS